MKTLWDLLLELAAAEEKVEDEDDAIAEIKTEIKVVMVGCYGRRVCKGTIHCFKSAEKL